MESVVLNTNSKQQAKESPSDDSLLRVNLDSGVPRTTHLINIEQNGPLLLKSMSKEMPGRSGSSDNLVLKSSATNLLSSLRIGARGSIDSTNIPLEGVEYITPEDLMGLLENSQSSNSPSWRDKYSTLLIDLNDAAEFESNHIKNSVNINFPPLVLKRFKKKIFSNVNLSNFMMGHESKDIYDEWVQNDVKRCIVVYASAVAKDSDAHTFFYALASGMADDLVKGSQSSPRVVILSGGLSEFRQSNGSFAYIVSVGGNDDNIDEDEELTSPGYQVPIKMKVAPRLSLSMNLKPSRNPTKTSRNKEGDAQAANSMSLFMPLRDLDGPKGITEEVESPGSAYDNAAPPDPYSQVNKNILVGSDQVPLAPDAVDQLKAIHVTHVLNMAAEIKPSIEVEMSGEFGVMWIPVRDNTEQDMDEPLQDAINFMRDAVLANPSALIFVHCKAGRSRSVSVVIGYLIAVEKYTLESAYTLVRKCRKGVSPNLGFMAALLKVEKETHGTNTKLF